jgi:hypothetical protein
MKKGIIIVYVCLTGWAGFSQEIRFTDGNNAWDADSLGNHRAVVTFNGRGNIARTVILWRRRDMDPWDKRIIVEDAKTKQKVANVKTGIINNEKAELWFEPTSGTGKYYVYYMAAKNEGRSNYPKGVYLSPENTATDHWLHSINERTPVNSMVREIQAINAFNSFFPMEVIATVKETASLINKSNRSDYLVFPEDRLNVIKMTEQLPYRWVQKGMQTSFSGEASKGEYYTFQLGVYALQHLENVRVEFSDLKGSSGHTIAAANLSCINTSGVDYTGVPFTKTVDIEKYKVQALWCGIDVPQNTVAGIYKGHVIIKTKNAASATIAITLIVNDKVLTDGGIGEPWKQTRLKWLNSTLAQENTVIDPYTALQVQDNTISLLGRKVELNKDGLPSRIQTFFTPEMTDFQQTPNSVLSGPIHFIISAADAKTIEWKNNGLQFVKKEAGTVQWKATSTSEALQMDVDGSLEFDGFSAYSVKITATKDVQINDIVLQIPFTKAASKYMMGLGQKGGNRPENFAWKWEVAAKNQDGAWIGNVNAGLQYSLRDEKYVRPLNTNFYLQKPLLLPSSWGNNNKGGITIKEENNSTLVNNYSGERKMKKGDVLYYNFTLLITPFHPVNTDFQWATRFYHKYDSPGIIRANGATIVNIHHATPINPWINYPFIEYRRMKAYIDSAHTLGLKVKIYNTIRELSNHAYETFPLRSLGHEIYSTGKGGGFNWLQEHVGEDYIAAWFVPELKDAAIVNSGMSRWHNYYVEGMNWLTQQVGIDGIYLDDVAFDRVTMKRIKRVLTRDGHPGIIDLHSANQYNKNDGFNNSANLYMEHFPYLNRLWFGEYFDYEKNMPDFFLTEVSGIPFGLMGEMLQDGGNPWRGMIYGMTNRYPWSEDADPRPIWKFWDEFGMKGTEMIGYWSDNCPVKTNNDKVLATVFKKNGAALISIASWAENKTDVQLIIDWDKLGIDPAKVTVTAFEIKNFQPARIFAINEPIPVEKGKGWLLVVK